jgi:hypothetical protein
MARIICIMSPVAFFSAAAVWNWRSILRSTLFYRFCPSIPSRKSQFCRRFRKAIPALPPPH